MKIARDFLAAILYLIAHAFGMVCLAFGGLAEWVRGNERYEEFEVDDGKD